MGVLTLYADASISGNVAGATNAFGAPDGTWTTTTGNSNWTHRWGMQNPTAGSSINGTHTVTVRARKEVAQTGVPTIQVQLYQNGVSVKSLVSTSNVTSETGEDFSGTFTSADISSPNDLQIEIVTTSAGGSPSVRTAVLVDSITWSGDFVINYTQFPTDNQDLTDVSRLFDYSWARTHNLGLTDAVTTVANYPRSLTDNMGLITPPLELLRTRALPSDSIGVTDSNVREFVLTRSHADNENLTDSVKTLNAQQSGFWIFEYDGQVG